MLLDVTMRTDMLRWALATLLALISLHLLAQQRIVGVAPPDANEKRVALVIGNAKYLSAPLRNPVNDAVDIDLPEVLVPA